MDSVTIDERAEWYVHAVAARMLRPRTDECLCCYVARMLDDFGCDTSLRFARSYRDQVARRATALEKRLGDLGGFCDCEIFLNAMVPAPHLVRVEEDDPVAEPEADADGASRPRMPPCGGVRRGSTQPCANWARRPRHGGGGC